MRRLGLAVAVVAVMGGMAAACGEDATESEREYLRGFCRALDEFSDRVSSSSDPTSLEGAVESLIASLGSLAPPDSLAGFHTAFIDYARAVAADPGAAVDDEVPRPPDAVRERLEAAERDIPECWDATPFEVSP